MAVSISLNELAVVVAKAHAEAPIDGPTRQDALAKGIAAGLKQLVDAELDRELQEEAEWKAGLAGLNPSLPNPGVSAGSPAIVKEWQAKLNQEHVNAVRQHLMAKKELLMSAFQVLGSIGVSAASGGATLPVVAPQLLDLARKIASAL